MTYTFLPLKQDHHGHPCLHIPSLSASWVSELLSLLDFLIRSASPISLFLLDVSLLCVPVSKDVCECSHIYTFMLSALIVGLY